MTWLWDKVRHSLRSGRLQIQLRKLLNTENSVVHLFTHSEEEEVRECEDADLISYFGACSVCKLAINRSRNFDPSTLDFLSTRSSTCPVCGLRCRNSTLQRTEENDEHGDNINEITDVERRSNCDPSLSSDRLPPIRDLGVDNVCAGSGGTDNNELAGRLKSLDTLLCPSSRMTFLLPPIVKNAEMAVTSESKRGVSSVSCKRNNIYVDNESEMSLRNVPCKSRQEFLHDLRKARQRENYSNLQHFYRKAYSSFGSLCTLFKVNPSVEKYATPEDPGLKMEFIYAVHDAILELPPIIEKIVLKSIVSSLLEKTKTTYKKDKMRAVFILLQCPVFTSQNSYVVFAHLLRYCIHLPSSHHQLLVGWLKILEVKRLRAIVRQLLQFITVRQFSTGDKTLPPLNKSRWWIPIATKLLALINIANNGSSPPLLDYTELYNSALDHIDLMQDYYVWQNCRHPGQFAYCQYPFILSVLAKRFILTKDSEQQMILNARKSLVAKMTRHQTPQVDIFFLNINVRRSCLLDDSLNEITCKQRDLKKKLKVSFLGEPGLDMGGLTKEWFLLLVREIFHSNYGMFVYHPHSQCYWFSVDNMEGNLREKLLTPPIIPQVDKSHIGVIESPTLDDLKEIMPDVAHGLKKLLEYDGNVEEDMGMTFQLSLEEFGAVKTFQLKEGGSDIPVTNENRLEYVQTYLNWILNTAIYEQFKAFYLGFHSVCASNALIMLRGEEVEMLVCGSQTFELSELRKVTEYDGFNADEVFIENFWNVMENLSQELKKKLLLFATGSDRIPVGGVSEMSFKITRLPQKMENLPEAHTCFNQLVLPRYENKTILREKLITAISNAEGFGLE